MSDPTLLTSSDARWLLLSLLPGFGLRARERVSANTDALTDILDMSPASLQALAVPKAAREAVLAWQTGDSTHPVMARVTAILESCNHHGIAVVGQDHHHFPEALRQIHGAPLLLYALGDTALLGRDQIAIVGSRNATRAGLDHARRFASVLGERGLLVTSGLALGIDGAAHAGALDGGFATLAVIGCGLDRIYPAQHRKLAHRVIEHGLIVSEYPPGTQARAAHFPQRNRIISGLSRGVLVVEAGLKSGSLITARLALEQGREVFAIPGSVHSPVARGCHQLIRQGACLVETVDDVLEELGTWWSLASQSDGHQANQPAAQLDHLDSREIAVFEALGYDPQSTDALGQATGLPADQLMQSLLLLELEGLVSAAPGGYLKIA